MKKLTKIRLINWHYFANETIEVKNDVLLTGQNATGKSTIMDAIQYVLTAGEQNFNMAAHDHGNRNLRGYICCKLGLDNQEYLRNGDVSSHIALEFFDTLTNQYTTIGTVLDYKSSIDTVKFVFYQTPLQMVDEMFIKDGVILSGTGIKETGLIHDIYTTKRDAKIAFRNFYGPVNERFFTLIQKALAFKPINNVKDFIYQYLLEEKKIDVETIQDSIRMYKDLERTLKVIKRKINDLSELNRIASEIKLKNEKSTIHDLLIKLVGIEELQNKADKLKQDLKKVIAKRDDQLEIIKDLENTIRIYDEKSKILYSNLISNDAFKNKEQLQGQIDRMKSELQIAENKKQKYLSQVIANNTMLDAYIARNDFKAYKQLRNLPLSELSDLNYNDLKSKVLEISTQLQNRVEDLYEDLGQLRMTKKELGRKYDMAVQTIKALEGRQLRYNPNVIALRDAINDAFVKNGIDARVGILAELLEISDLSWSDAIENYLAAQRFTLIVEPAYFDFALDVFDEIKSKRQIYGVGLVNTKKMVGYDKCDDNTLASLITSNNIYAKRYINMVLGHVMCASSTRDLENYRTAITKDSVVYNNYTVRQLNTHIDKPFIGRDAIKMQLPKYQAEERKIHGEYVEIDASIRKIEEEINVVSRLNLKQIVEGMSSVLAVKTQNNIIKDLTTKRAVKTDTTGEAASIQKEYEAVSDKLKDLNSQLLKAHEELGRIGGEITNLENAILAFENQVIEYQDVFTKIKMENIALENQVYSIYVEDAKTYKTSELFNKYNKEQESNLKAISNFEDELKAKQLAYNSEYNFLGTLGFANMETYYNEYDRLVRSNLIEYEDKVRAAREDTERIFKEDFIAKLRSNILAAQDGVRKINQALQTTKFGDECYEFIFPKAKEFEGIYDMVMSENEDVNGPIVTPEFEMKYNQEMAMLFDTLSVDEINSEGVINKYTDYRTYMDYDIKIINSNGEVAMFSKILKEKSGGETQVPFYVSIIASFVQMYSNARSSIGLIMFDEAFDKMDSTRIARMMEFVRDLDLQLIIAATPQKLYPITNYVDTTLIIFRDGRQSYVVPKVNK